MVCDICGKNGARTRKVSRTYGKGKNLLVIENILHRKSLAVERPVEVIEFA